MLFHTDTAPFVEGSLNHETHYTQSPPSPHKRMKAVAKTPQEGEKRHEKHAWLEIQHEADDRARAARYGKFGTGPKELSASSAARRLAACPGRRSYQLQHRRRRLPGGP